MFCSKVLPAAGRQCRLVQTTAENHVREISSREKKIRLQIISVIYSNVHHKNFKKYSTYPAGSQAKAMYAFCALKNLIYPNRCDFKRPVLLEVGRVKNVKGKKKSPLLTVKG